MLTTLKNRLSADAAAKGYFAVTALALVYHALILTQVVHYSNAWGGQLQSLEQMYTFEAVSVTLQILLAVIVYIKAYKKASGRAYRIVTVLTLLIAALFILNTVGNIFATGWIERFIFTPVTLIAALLTFRVAID